MRSISYRAVISLKSFTIGEVGGSELVANDGQTCASKVGAMSSGAARMLCVSPGEWLILSQTETASQLRARFIDASAERDLVVSDVSDAFAAFVFEGPLGVELLTRACALDFDSRHFPNGQCARTRFAQIAAIVQCVDEPHYYEVLVARSYARYVSSWCIDAVASIPQ